MYCLAGFLEEISESIQRGRFGGGASDLHPLGFNFIPISLTRSTTPIWLCYGPWHLSGESHITICEYNLVDLSPRGEAAGVVVGGDTETLFVFG